MSLPPTDLLQRFGLSAPKLVAETARAKVWRVRRGAGAWAALKYYPAGHMGNEASGLAYLERCEGAGAVRVFERSADAVLMEWLEGPSLGDLARAKGAEAADHGVTDVAARLCATRISGAGLLPVSTVMSPLRDASFSSPEAQDAQGFARACLDQLQCGVCGGGASPCTAICTTTTSSKRLRACGPLTPRDWWGRAPTSWPMRFVIRVDVAPMLQTRR